MKSITVRPARPGDASQMADLLNEIIEIGGTTAFLEIISASTMETWMAKESGQTSWLVAEENDLILGFQSAKPRNDLPSEAASIASFVRVDTVGRGVGHLLFAETCARLRALGYEWINATIRSDNESGLRFYSKMGFADWKVDPDAQLSDGRVTGKNHKWYSLKVTR